MFCMSFKVPGEMVRTIDKWLDSHEIYNVSIFDDNSSGLSNTLDENGFQISKLCCVDIYDEEVDNLLSIKEICESEFNNVSCTITKVEDLDWEKEYIDNLKPIQVGKFYFYNENYQDPSCDAINIKINSVMAFGTGEHETTHMCIELLSYISDKNIRSVLDMGCGTGILSICASKLFSDISITAVDIEESAINATYCNFNANGVSGDILLNDFDNKFFRENTKQFDLIFCNILQNPLISMKDEFAKILHGYIITSGYVKDQENTVLQAYNGMTLVKTLYKNQWVAHLFTYNT